MFSAYKPYDIVWESDTLSIKIPVKGYGFNHSDEKVVQDIERAKTWFETQITRLAAIINTFSIELKQNIELWITARKSIIEQQQNRYDSLIKKIPIPLFKKENAAANRIKAMIKSNLHISSELPFHSIFNDLLGWVLEEIIYKWINGLPAIIKGSELNVANQFSII